MSGKAINWAYTFTGMTPSTKLVLITICQYYNERRHGAWPSVARMARDTGLSERHITRCISQLRLAGLIDVRPRFDGNRQTTNDYYLPLYSDASEPSSVGLINRRYDAPRGAERLPEIAG